MFSATQCGFRKEYKNDNAMNYDTNTPVCTAKRTCR